MIYNSNIDDLQIKIIKSARIGDLKQIYKEAGWWESAWCEQPDFLNRIVQGSAVFVGAFLDNRLRARQEITWVF